MPLSSLLCDCLLLPWNKILAFITTMAWVLLFVSKVRRNLFNILFLMLIALLELTCVVIKVTDHLLHAMFQRIFYHFHFSFSLFWTVNVLTTEYIFCDCVTWLIVWVCNFWMTETLADLILQAKSPSYFTTLRRVFPNLQQIDSNMFFWERKWHAD